MQGIEKQFKHIKSGTNMQHLDRCLIVLAALFVLHLSMCGLFIFLVLCECIVLWGDPTGDTVWI